MVKDKIKAFESAIVAREDAFHNWLASQDAYLAGGEPALWHRYITKRQNVDEKRKAFEENPDIEQINTPRPQRAGRFETDGITIDLDLGIYIEIGGEG